MAMPNSVSSSMSEMKNRTKERTLTRCVASKISLDDRTRTGDDTSSASR